MTSIRKAGDAVAANTDKFGDWKDNWDSSAAHQQVKGNAAGYSADSRLSKKFATLSKSDNTSVDDGDGWVSLVNSKDNKNAGSYADQVAKWQAAGYDVRAQDMGDQYGEANIAVRRAKGKRSSGEQPVAQTEGKPASIGGGTGGGEQGGATVKPQEFKDNYATNIDESFNAQGGTLNNSGDLTAGRDITLDNSVTNQNTMNSFGGDIRNFTYNAPGGGGGSGGGSGSGGASYPTMNSYKDPALNATPVSAATMAGFYKPSDSPAAAAKFNALHSELNRGKQEKYANAGSDIASKYISAAEKTKTIDTKALNANLAAQPEYNFAQSDLITAQTFGDIWKFKPQDYYMPDPFVKPEQPDFEGMQKSIFDEIKG